MQGKSEAFKKRSVFLLLLLLCGAFIAPIIIVLMNSFKGQLYISASPFSLPTPLTFTALENYQNGINRTGFFTAFFY